MTRKETEIMADHKANDTTNPTTNSMSIKEKGLAFIRKKDQKAKAGSMWVYFLIGAVLGAIFFVCIYGFGVLDVTNEDWLLTGKDLQQHYVGWKSFRQGAWKFPIGLHNGLTYPYDISVLFTDSIPLFAVIFKLLSPLLPKTFQYFGLFGLTCFILNGGFGALLVAKINKSKLFVAAGSVFFILSTPVLQRLYGLLTENSRHTSLAAHFLILAALLIWVYHENVGSMWKGALYYGILAFLCVWIQMYLIFIVGGLMCGYLLYHVMAHKDWKRVFVTFGSFGGFTVLAMWLIGGFTSVLDQSATGFGRYSANLNTLWNPYNYSSFFDPIPWGTDQYEGFAYLGLGMLFLYALLGGILLFTYIRCRNKKALRFRLKRAWRRNKEKYVPVLVVSIVFFLLAISSTVVLNGKIIAIFIPPDWCMYFLNIVRSSGRFMWVILYLAIFVGLFLLCRIIPNRFLQKCVVIFCVGLQLMDLAKPIYHISKQYVLDPPPEDEQYAQDDFWKTTLGNYKNLVYYPLGSGGVYPMLQIGTKANDLGLKMNYFYLSRFFEEKYVKKVNKENKNLFETGNLDKDTIYIIDYRTAHKYRDRCYQYCYDQRIIATKDPIPGGRVYNDVYISKENPNICLKFSYNALGTEFEHRGFNETRYGEDGTWTNGDGVFRFYSGGAKKVRITIDYKSDPKRAKKGTTIFRVGNTNKAIVDNSSSGTVEFDASVKETISEKEAIGINWLFISTKKPFHYHKNTLDENRGIYIRSITIQYLE